MVTTTRRQGRATRQDAPQTLSGASQGTLPPRSGSATAVGLSDGPQRLVLDGFPTIAQVRALGPNSSVGNRYAVSRLRQSVKANTAVEARRQGIRRVPSPALLTLRYVFSDARARDQDNFAVIAKPVVDALVKAKLLDGDDAARLTCRVEFVKEPGARRLEVVLEPAGRGA